MPSVTERESAEFFVVGGPVQADRPCYVERAADRRLEAALREKRLCCVLGPRAIGKSSLLLRAARSLRGAGTLVATLDLRRIADQGEAEKGAGWLRRVAARVAGELKLGVDVDSWLSSRHALGDNTLVEFFWEVVLTNTTAPIVVLVDEIDSALDLPFGTELLEAIAECYERRSREADFARLGFALAGSVSQRELAEESAAPVFAEAEVVEPDDFDAEQTYHFAAAFGGDQDLAQALLDRIRAWTGGHPYLTQRVARGVARKGGRLEDVERVVREQLLAPGAADKDPLLGHVRAWLSEPTRPARRAMRLLQRLGSGGRVAQPADAAVWERLWLSGAVAADQESNLRIRNRIVKELVAARWLRPKRGPWRWAAAAAIVLAAAAGGAYWYTQQLPVADIATLTDAAAEPNAVENAYRRLRGLPGFAERADVLWVAALSRQSRAATTLAVAAAADVRLRELPGQGAVADGLLSEFWLRRAREQAHAEQRDAGILLAQRAAALPAADPAAVALLAELVGDDYSRLERSLRLVAPPEYWHMAFGQALVVSIDAAQQATRTAFGASAADALDATPLKLTALAHSALARELAVDGEGTAGEFELTLSVQHAAAAELLVTLTAPSGAEAAVSVPRNDGALVETFAFQAAQGSLLAQLADEGVRGTWRLTVVDRAGGNTGTFGGWGLRFGDTVVRDDVFELLAIPDPTRVETVNVRAAGERAVAWPVTAGAVGAVALWNLTTGELEGDFTLPAAPRQVALDATGARLLAATDRVLQVWNVADGALAGRVATETEFVLPPVFSADGGYVAIAERVDGANPLYSVLRSADASLVASIEGLPDAQAWELGPGGRYVALQGPETLVRVLETRRGAELGRLGHVQAVERLLHTSDGTTLVTVDRRGAIAAWPLGTTAAAARPLGRTAAADSISASADARRLAFTRDDGAVAVVDVPTGAELYRLRLTRSSAVTRTQLSQDGVQLVTQSGPSLRLWSLPGKSVSAAVTRDVVPTALALDRTSDLVAVGLASGQLQVAPLAAASASSPLAYFGHRGRITAAALNRDRGLAATGGADGTVRIWDAVAGAPTGIVAQPADGAVTLVALSGDGQYVAGVRERVVRVAAIADGGVTAELQAEAPVTAIAFAPDAASVAVGDAVGTVLIARFVQPSRSANVRLAAAVTSLAFAADGGRIAIGDASGSVTLVDAESGETRSTVRHWSSPIRWLDFSGDGGVLLVATDGWLHALAATTLALEPLQSKLAAWPASDMVAAAVSATAVGFAGIATDGALVSGVLELAAGGGDVRDGAVLVARDWQTALALRLNDNGDPVPLEP